MTYGIVDSLMNNLKLHMAFNSGKSFNYESSSSETRHPAAGKGQNPLQLGAYIQETRNRLRNKSRFNVGASAANIASMASPTAALELSRLSFRQKI